MSYYVIRKIVINDSFGDKNVSADMYYEDIEYKDSSVIQSQPVDVHSFNQSVMKFNKLTLIDAESIKEGENEYLVLKVSRKQYHTIAIANAVPMLTDRYSKDSIIEYKIHASDIEFIPNEEEGRYQW